MNTNNQESISTSLFVYVCTKILLRMEQREEYSLSPSSLYVRHRTITPMTPFYLAKVGQPVETSINKASRFRNKYCSRLPQIVPIWVFRRISSGISWLIPLLGRSLIPASKKAIRVTDIPMNKKNIAGHNETRTRSKANGSRNPINSQTSN